MSGDDGELESLVARARAGDVNAFGAIYQRHQAGIYSFIRSQVRDPELATDLTQQTFVQAWRGLGRLRTVAAFRGWLHRIAGNLVRDEVKSGRSRLEITASALATDPIITEDSGARVEQRLEAEELRGAVRQALDALSPEQRAAVVMHHLEGMSVREIAAAQGVRRGTVMSRLARAREALRQQLAPYVEGTNDDA